jgi:putative component of toxin-antitoxin plasmid stabilization module
MRVEKTDVYRAWIDGLRDRAGRARILVRVERLIHGNPGKNKSTQQRDIAMAIQLAKDFQE